MIGDAAAVKSENLVTGCCQILSSSPSAWTSPTNSLYVTKKIDDNQPKSGTNKQK